MSKTVIPPSSSPQRGSDASTNKVSLPGPKDYELPVHPAIGDQRDPSLEKKLEVAADPNSKLHLLKNKLTGAAASLGTTDIKAIAQAAGMLKNFMPKKPQ